MSEQLEALKVLYEGHQGAVKALSERSFTTTLQAIGFDVAIIAALVAGNVRLADDQRNYGAVFLGGFSILVSIYIVSKAASHHCERKRLHQLESRLRATAVVDARKPPSFWLSFIFGSLLFVVITLLAGAGAVWWIQTWSPA